MRELIRTNDAVLLSYLESRLRDAAIDSALLDGHMSVVEGSLGVLPRRLMVQDGDWVAASRILEEIQK